MTRAQYTLTQAADFADEDRAVVSVAGEVDVTNAPEFADAVRDLRGPEPVVLDLSDVTYLDSAGFATLDRLLASGEAAIVIPSESPLRRAAELMHLVYYDSVEGALRGR